jgi:integrase
MSEVFIAKSPNLNFLKLKPYEKFKYPLLLNADKSFHWDANQYLLKYGGGSLCYGVRPQPDNIIEEARSLNILFNFIDKLDDVNVYSFSDEHFYDYISHLKSRNIDNDTIKGHARVAINYFFYIQDTQSEFHLITHSTVNANKYSIHVTKESFNAGGRIIRYYDHWSFKGLVNIQEEVEYIRDHEFIHWLDAIHHTTEHPQPYKLLILRWESISYLLDATGARISELSDITRSMIKRAYEPLTSADEEVELKSIPVNKGKYKGNDRTVLVSNGTLQLVMSYINMIEKEWPNMRHDELFINLSNGKPLKYSYLKNYTLNVIKNSKFSAILAHLNNHSFRHRFITLNVAKTLKSYKSDAAFTNILTVAMSAVRKLTLHASNSTMEQYVHLAQKYNKKLQFNAEKISTPIKVEITRMKLLLQQFKNRKISEVEALTKISTIIDNI